MVTKKELFKKCSLILNSYKIGDSLNKEDNEFIINLLKKNHPKSKEKIGRFKKVRVVDDGHGHQCFKLKETFSYKSCVSPSNRTTLVKESFRNEIWDQTHSFKKSTFNGHKTIRCPVTDYTIDWSAAHVDHEPPNTLNKLILDFMEEHSLSFDDIRLDKTKKYCSVLKNTPKWMFSDRQIAKKWRNWHKKRCSLRVIFKKENLWQGHTRKKAPVEIIICNDYE